MKNYGLIMTALYILMWSWFLIDDKKTIRPFPLFQIHQINARFYVITGMFFIVIAYLTFAYYKINPSFDSQLVSWLFCGLLAFFFINDLQPIWYFHDWKFKIVQWYIDTDGITTPVRPKGFFVPVGYPLVMGITMILHFIPKLFR